ncbi:MAG: 23S rRNA (pseudouridine(1915)-N(3))-methyltransferase RlmH [Candidatus Acidiferrales bacterium]
MKIQLLLLGKTRRAEIRTLVEDYAARIRRHAAIEITELRETSPAELRKIKIEPGARVVLLDDGGKQFTSEEFAKWLGAQRDGGARTLVFLCGGAEGFPEALRRAAQTRISLSKLTFSHELARAMLLEQIYRAFAILSGHPYPK